MLLLSFPTGTRRLPGATSPLNRPNPCLKSVYSGSGRLSILPGSPLELLGGLGHHPFYLQYLSIWRPGTLSIWYLLNAYVSVEIHWVVNQRYGRLNNRIKIRCKAVPHVPHSMWNAWNARNAKIPCIDKTSLLILQLPCMTYVATITSKNQLTLPARLFVETGLRRGQKVIVSEEDGKIILTPAEKLVEELAGSVPVPKEWKGKGIDQIIEESREEYFSQNRE